MAHVIDPHVLDIELPAGYMHVHVLGGVGRGYPIHVHNTHSVGGCEVQQTEGPTIHSDLRGHRVVQQLITDVTGKGIMGRLLLCRQRCNRDTPTCLCI